MTLSSFEIATDGLIRIGGYRALPIVSEGLLRFVEAGGYKRYKLPDGRVTLDPQEAMLALEGYVGSLLATEIARITPPTSRAKLKKPSVKNALQKRKQIERAALLIGEIPLPEVIERLPEPVKAKIDPDLVALAVELIARREEDDLIVLLLT